MKRLITILALAAAAPGVALAQTQACPTITTTGPTDTVPAGQPVVVSAKVEPAGDYTYSWSVESGAIKSGQKTTSVSIDAPPDSVVTATVEVGGLAKRCTNASSFSAVTAAK